MKEEVRNRIREIGAEIEKRINRVVCFEDAETGRRGKRCYLATAKRGIGIEVIGYMSPQPYSYVLALAINNGAATIDGQGDDEVRTRLRKKIGETQDQIENFVGADHAGFNGKNIRICQYSLDNFQTLWQIIQDDELGLEESENRGVKLFKKDYSLEKIVARYRSAIEREDQVLLDLSRRLLEADDMDHLIAVNRKESPYHYREHVVPCIKIHNMIVEKIYKKGSDDGDIVELLGKHLKIVHIHNSEAAKLNDGLRTEMPQSWTFEDSPYARLIERKIKVRNIKGGLDLRVEFWGAESLLIEEAEV